MTGALPDQAFDCDLLVIGAGAGGLSTAITAKKLGLDVIVLEKEEFFGGTTAFSGGVLWIPNTRHFSRESGASAGNSAIDTHDAALRYLVNETGRFFDSAAIEEFLDRGPEMVEFFERETEVQFIPTLYPDYHPDVEGGATIGRSIMAAPFDTRALGKDLARLRPPLQTITFMGMMFNSSSADLKHFFKATRSLTSAIYVGKRLLAHMREVLVHGRGVQVTAGNALAARLAKSALDLDIPIRTSTAARELVTEEGRVSGVRLASGAVLRARRAVVLACGGFSHDLERVRRAFPHVAQGGEHLSPTAPGATGDGARMAEAVGGRVEIRYPEAAAWMPVSTVPLGQGRVGAFPHLLDRYKPGVIGVLRNGRRFTNESNSYHDVGAAMIAACKGEADTAMWLICDSATIGKYGLGFAKPAPLPLRGHVKSGYLMKDATIAGLARQAGIDPAGLEATIREYNLGATKGEDAQFGRGSTAFNRYLADPDQKPNPCVAPIGAGPYYALKLIMGDLGTFDGIETTVAGQVLDSQNQIIPGLFAVGNDRASIMGGNYPGAGITLGPIMTFGYVTARFIAHASP